MKEHKFSSEFDIINAYCIIVSAYALSKGEAILDHAQDLMPGSSKWPDKNPDLPGTGGVFYSPKAAGLVKRKDQQSNLLIV